jgi:sortase B
MKNGTMFHDLIQYKQQDYYDKHPTIYLFISGRTYELQIFSVYVEKANADMRRVDFADDKAFTDYIKTLQSKSIIKTPALAGKENEIFTLITCTYETSDARLLVHARVVRETNAAAK